MIYHYTNIETLALILDQGKIRFNRLDQVDDILESSEFKRFNFSKYLFVSCWTENPEDNIALWTMYSRNMKGVRIGFDRLPFKMKRVNKSSSHIPIEVTGERELPLTIDECFHTDYFIVPLFMDEKQFYKKIQYLDDFELKQRYDLMVEKVKNQDGTYSISAKTEDFAKIKHKRWTFQEETRFVLLIVPPIKIQDISNAIDQIVSGVPLNITYFDMDLDKSILQEMAITIGPNCSQADKLIVESLRTKYCLKNEVKDSELTKIIRFKK